MIRGGSKPWRHLFFPRGPTHATGGEGRGRLITVRARLGSSESGGGSKSERPNNGWGRHWKQGRKRADALPRSPAPSGRQGPSRGELASWTTAAAAARSPSHGRGEPIETVHQRTCNTRSKQAFPGPHAGRPATLSSLLSRSSASQASPRR